jgi:hypothetical protein
MEQRRQVSPIAPTRRLTQSIEGVCHAPQNRGHRSRDRTAARDDIDGIRQPVATYKRP